MKSKMSATTVVLIAFAAISAAFAHAEEAVTISGAGATFPYPLYHVMFETFTRQTGTKITYDAIGSGGGIKALTEKKVDFAGTDAFMSPQEIARAGAPIVHIPICMGAVVVAYNLAGDIPMSFSPQVIADIFLGKISKWNDPRILELNPRVKISDIPMHVVHRTDASGTTAIFTEYLSKVSPEWRSRIGSGKTVQWATGQGGKGNPGVAGLVKQVMGSIGYVELIYALGNNMKVASVQNRSGNFIQPCVESVSRAGTVEIPADTNISLTDTAAPHGYPIAGFTWIALYQQQDYGSRSRSQARELAGMLWWMTHEGQALTRPFHYSPLPEEAVRRSEALLKSITFGASPALNGWK
jgi:phosphate transport system substrate-binding protein